VLTFVTTNLGPVRVRLFDLRGRLVRSLLDDPYASSGYHDVRLDGRDDSGARLASGLYFYQIDSGDGQTVGKLSVLK
jgi:flagellar hook assembly protein FlgD